MATQTEQIKSQILAILHQSNQPLSAYDLLGQLQPSYSKLAPPTVYRILTTLIKQGRIHKMESMNAFIACQCDHNQHTTPVLSICKDCGTVEETIAPNIIEALSKIGQKSGFKQNRHVIEVHGQCSDCNTEGQA